jgi:hypothetical protein
MLRKSAGIVKTDDTQTYMTLYGMNMNLVKSQAQEF